MTPAIFRIAVRIGSSGSSANTSPDSAVNTGFATIVIAHVMFTVSYVVVTVKARLEGMDRHIEEAAMDLGATEWTTFRKVTLPLALPGVLTV